MGSPRQASPSSEHLSSLPLPLPLPSPPPPPPPSSPPFSTSSRDGGHVDGPDDARDCMSAGADGRHQPVPHQNSMRGPQHAAVGRGDDGNGNDSINDAASSSPASSSRDPQIIDWQAASAETRAPPPRPATPTPTSPLLLLLPRDLHRQQQARQQRSPPSPNFRRMMDRSGSLHRHHHHRGTRRSHGGSSGGGVVRLHSGGSDGGGRAKSASEKGLPGTGTEMEMEMDRSRRNSDESDLLSLHTVSSVVSIETTCTEDVEASSASPPSSSPPPSSSIACGDLASVGAQTCEACGSVGGTCGGSPAAEDGEPRCRNGRRRSGSSASASASALKRMALANKSSGPPARQSYSPQYYCRPRRTMGSFAAWSFGGGGGGGQQWQSLPSRSDEHDNGAPKNDHGQGSSGQAGGGGSGGSGGASDPVVLFGLDLTDQPPSVQFFVCACGVFAFTIIYGYLQELLAVHIAGRQFGLFLATAQFAGYALWSFVLTRFGTYRHGRLLRQHQQQHRRQHHRRSDDGDGDDDDDDDDDAFARDDEAGAAAAAVAPPPPPPPPPPTCLAARKNPSGQWTVGDSAVPLRVYVGLSFIRAVDLGMTNLAMQFLNYPAKTLIKSSRVVFTMFLGLVIGRKRYRCRDYLSVSLLVVGLGVFLHADSRSSVVFHPLGVVMLCVSLTCDGTLNNWSEVIMREYSVGQDEFQLQLYSIALLAMMIAAHLKGELILGIKYFVLTPGTVPEILSGEFTHDPTTWTVMRKINILILFSTTGLLGSSCAGAITKRFGALSMSITSTARKAMTLFLSFVAFPNKCTVEHVAGMTIFLSALLMKSLCAHHHANATGEGGAKNYGGSGRSMQLQDSPSAVAGSDKLSPEDEEMLLPLTATAEPAAVHAMHDRGKSSKTVPVDTESGLTDDEHRHLINGDTGGSLFETARRSRRISSLFGYLPRWQRGLKSCSSSHSS